MTRRARSPLCIAILCSILACDTPHAGEVLVEVAPGAHVMACVRRGADGHRHGSTGGSKTIVVVSSAPADTARAPAPSQELAMVDFAYPGSERWDVGVRMLRVENRGHHEHQVRIARLRPGVTLRQWLEAEDAPGVDSTVAGVARLGPGATAYLPVELAVGSYVLYCLITDPATDKPHVELGMFKAIEVTTGSAR